jgi:hypothetical protein
MRWVRRVHLALGLALLPLILLYGVSAFLFNHPTAFHPSERVRLSAEQLESAGLERISAHAGELANEVARSVAAGVGRTRGEGGAPAAPVTIERLRNARVLGSERFERRSTRALETLAVDAESGAALVTRRPPRAEPGGGALDREAVRIEPVAATNAALRSAAASAALTLALGGAPERGEVRLRSGPIVAFEADVDGVAHELRYDMGATTLSARAVPSAPAALDLRAFLLRLHVAHDYPVGGGVRTLWAVLVDVMAFAMVAFALSGVAMWWQLRATRVWGGSLVAVSVIAALLVGAAMYVPPAT